jgi:chromosome partitioning protein
MRTLVVASRKGGSSKTSLSAHLAVEAERVGHGPVVVIDTDPQRGLAGWWDARVAETPVLVNIAGDLAATLAALREQGAATVIIDTPPQASPEIQEAVALADLVLIPVRPSPNDLRAVGSTINMVRAEKRKMTFVITQANSRAKITNEAVITLSQYGTVAPTLMGFRQDYATSMTDGRSAGELDASSPSAKEISDLWSYLHSRLQSEDSVNV